MNRLDKSVTQRLISQTGEDPRREPHEKETALHLEGDATYFSVTSYKRTVFSKLLQRPSFEVDWFRVRDDDGHEKTLESPETVANSSSLTIIGVEGRLPVGAVSIGTPREDDSHRDLVR